MFFFRILAVVGVFCVFRFEYVYTHRLLVALSLSFWFVCFAAQCTAKYVCESDERDEVMRENEKETEKSHIKHETHACKYTVRQT